MPPLRGKIQIMSGTSDLRRQSTLNKSPLEIKKWNLIDQKKKHFTDSQLLKSVQDSVGNWYAIGVLRPS